MIIDTKKLDNKTRQIIEMIYFREPGHLTFGKKVNFFDKVEVEFRKANNLRDALSVRGLASEQAIERIESDPENLKELTENKVISSKDRWVCTFSINDFSRKYGTSVGAIFGYDKQQIKQLVDAIDAKFGLPGLKHTHEFVYHAEFDDWYSAKIWLESWEKFYELQHGEIKKFIDDWIDSYIKASLSRRIKFWFKKHSENVMFDVPFPLSYLAKIPDLYRKLKRKFKAKKVEQ